MLKPAEAFYYFKGISHINTVFLLAYRCGFVVSTWLWMNKNEYKSLIFTHIITGGCWMNLIIGARGPQYLPIK